MLFFTHILQLHTDFPLDSHFVYIIIFVLSPGFNGLSCISRASKVVSLREIDPIVAFKLDTGLSFVAILLFVVFVMVLVVVTNDFTIFMTTIPIK